MIFLSRHWHLPPSLNASAVDPMPLRNFPAIIQGPARLAGLQLDDGLVETIVQDTGTRDALPLLAFTLRRLCERYSDDGRLTVGEYESLGRLEGAVREAAERVLTEATPSPEELYAEHTKFWMSRTSHCRGDRPVPPTPPNLGVTFI